MAINNIYLFLGQERLIIKNKIDRIINEVKADEYNITSYDLEEVNVAEAIKDAMTFPFISNKKVVIMNNPTFLTSSKTDIDHNINFFCDYVNNPNESTVLIINALDLKLDERKEAVKILLKKATTNKTNDLTDIELSGWLKRQFAIEKIDIKDDAIKLFFNITGNNLSNAKNEVDKLICYIGPGGVVTSADVNDVVVKEIENDIFALSNAIMSKDKDKIINVYHELLLSGNDPVTLFGLSSKAIKDSYLVRLMLDKKYNQSDVAKAMNVSNGRAFYLVKNAKSIDLEKTKKFICKFGDLDYKIKSGQIDAKTGFEFLLFEI